MSLRDTPVARKRWLWTSRAGFERDLAEELRHGSVLGPALALGDAPRPGDATPTFGRQGLPVERELESAPATVAAAAVELLPADATAFALHVWVPDSDAGNLLTAQAEALRAKVTDALGPRAALERRAHELHAGSDPVLQIALVSADRAVAGVVPSAELVSTWPGGRARMRLPSGAPSRASAKLLEALAWLGHGPGSGETCVDLGAAPGGWTFVLLGLRARVIAVDRANMAAHIAQNRRMIHVRKNAFEFRPEEPVDWLFCDMVHRPTEVAKLLASWGKRSDARLLVANVKLPMKKRVATVHQVRSIVAAGGWKDIRTRQLYHDRDEVTLAAHR